MSEGIHVHEPGRLSRWGVVDVGLKCMHSCKFCYYVHLDAGVGSEILSPFAGMRIAKFHSADHCKRLISGLAANGFIGADVTGGEPTLHPAVVDATKHARDVGLALRIITLGQYLMRPMKSAPGKSTLLEALLDAGVTDFLLSTHAVDDERFTQITGESWPKLRAAMDHLDAAGFDFCTNTTVCEQNFRDLPRIAQEIARHRVYVSNLIVMNAYYAWSRPGNKATEVQAHYSEVRPYLIEARDLLEAAGIAVNVRYAPLCTMRGLERNLVGVVGVRHDPHEWMNAIDHVLPKSPEVMAQRLPLRDHQANYPLMPVWTPNGVHLDSNWSPIEGDPIARRDCGKVFPAKCRGCRAMLVCDGVDSNYLERRGDAELEPYVEFRGDLLDRERLAYLPAYVCKTAPYADARGAVRKAFGR